MCYHKEKCEFFSNSTHFYQKGNITVCTMCNALKKIKKKIKKRKKDEVVIRRLEHNLFSVFYLEDCTLTFCSVNKKQKQKKELKKGRPNKSLVIITIILSSHSALSNH